ncbi:MAG: site-specific DNA-methyltransferase [Oscillospiraceae bacterium]|nr:site-specific DNA-methyltransferase [Oscillospiraceae bacterium]
MPFSYNPPTRSTCSVCEQLERIDNREPVIKTINGKASDANGYPFHGWYNFVLGFTPTFPEYILKTMEITADDIVLDPFNGSGTTQLVCKLQGIQSIGVDANDFMVYAANEKLNWNHDAFLLERALNIIIEEYERQAARINFNDTAIVKEIAMSLRPEMLDKRYMSDKPLIKIFTLKQAIEDALEADGVKSFFSFALASILVSVSNIKYGPGFGIGKLKEDVDVPKLYREKIDKMISDLKSVTRQQVDTESTTIMGDARRLSEFIDEETISLIVTSPPYPGDHEYTKHSRIELIFSGMATDLVSFRKIKKRMLRASTTNIYKDDNDCAAVINLESIIEVTKQIDERLKNDGATSGFEKLYTKLVWEYFGGMSKTFDECLKILRPGGKIALLVSDSHAFKMVHIQTAQILSQIGQMAGFVNPEIDLWQMKNSTSHKYRLRENILIMQKPF